MASIENIDLFIEAERQARIEFDRAADEESRQKWIRAKQATDEAVEIVQKEAAEYHNLFQRMWDADMRGIKYWTERNPHSVEPRWPDRTHMVEWLLDQLNAALPELEYRGYKGIAEFDVEAKVWHGRVKMVRDVVTFEAKTACGLPEAFFDSVNDYLAMCKERGEAPAPSE